MEKKIEKPMQKQKFVYAHISNREHPNIEAIKLIISCVQSSRSFAQYPKIIMKYFLWGLIRSVAI